MQIALDGGEDQAGVLIAGYGPREAEAGGGLVEIATDPDERIVLADAPIAQEACPAVVPVTGEGCWHGGDYSRFGRAPIRPILMDEAWKLDNARACTKVRGMQGCVRTLSHTSLGS
jgi:hypothetical protein